MRVNAIALCYSGRPSAPSIFRNLTSTANKLILSLEQARFDLSDLFTFRRQLLLEAGDLLVHSLNHNGIAEHLIDDGLIFNFFRAIGEPEKCVSSE